VTREEITAWALCSGWRLVAGHPSLTKPNAPKQPIVRLVFKVTVATLEVRKPAGKWEKVGSAAYGAIRQPADEDALPAGLGFEQIPSITSLMQQNRDAMVFSRLGG